MGGRSRANNPNCDPTRQPARPCPRCHMWPPMVEFYWSERTRRWESWCKVCNAKASAERRKTAASRETARRYRESEHGKARRKLYLTSERAKAVGRAYRASRRGRLLDAIRQDRYRLKRAKTERSRATIEAHMRAVRRIMAALGIESQRSERAAS